MAPQVGALTKIENRPSSLDMARGMLVPWWTRIAAKLVLSRLPLGYARWQKLGLFRHGSMDSSRYAIGVFDAHVAAAGLTGQLRGRTILEIGPGDGIASAIIAAAHGANSVLLDTGPFVRADILPYRELAEVLRDQGVSVPGLADCKTIDDILARCDARYLTDGLRSLKQLEDETVDLIFSQAVLEHVRKRELLETMRDCRRILKPGGVSSHRIDLQDHLGGALNNLRFSEPVWESEFFARSGFYTNRIQFSQMLDLFKHAGFEVKVTAVRRWESLPTPRGNLAKEFMSIPDTELCVSGFDVLLRKGTA
jgi:SAM-dependent methyltransferase